MVPVVVVGGHETGDRSRRSDPPIRRFSLQTDVTVARRTNPTHAQRRSTRATVVETSVSRLSGDESGKGSGRLSAKSFSLCDVAERAREGGEAGHLLHLDGHKCCIAARPWTLEAS